MISQSTPVSTYRPAQSLAARSILFLKLCILLDVCLIVSDWLQIELVGRVIARSGFTLPQIRLNDTRQEILNGGHVILAIITGIVVLRWIYIAYKNLPALGATGLKFTPRGLVASFFFPVLSFYRPYQAFAEMWKASQPSDNDPQGKDWRMNSVGRVLILWWLSWLSVGVLAAISIGIRFEKTLVSLQDATWANIASNIVDIVAAVLFIQIVRKINTWQQEKFNSRQFDFRYNRGSGAPEPIRRPQRAYLPAPRPQRFTIRKVPVTPAGEATGSG